MKKNLISLLLVVLCCHPLAATRHALVIGVGAYPQESGWRAINGDKDVPVVVELLQKNGFERKNILTLVNEQATRAGIKRGMGKILGRIKPGDMVYIHFSGHGQQVTDVDGDEEDGLDEAWVPYDARIKYEPGKYTGQNHILDDQLNVWVNQLYQAVGKEGKIVVVADACHSGNGTRGDDTPDSPVTRGARDTFVIPGNHPAYDPNKAPRPVHWIHVSACRDRQTNYEYQGKGSLTYALSQQGAKLQHMNSQELQRAIRQIVDAVVPYTQNPIVENPGQDNRPIIK